MTGLGVGFVGAGTVARLHAAAARQVAGVDLVGVFDRDLAQAESLAATVAGAAVYDSLESLLADDRIEAVYVLTPIPSHVGIATSCVEAGKHVLVEKPVSTDPSDIRGLAEVAAKKDVLVAPAHNYAHLPECARLIRQARSGALGTVRAMFVTYAIRHPEDYAAQYGGVFDEVLVHHTYLTLAALGRPDSVTAGLTTPGWERLTTDDQAWMVWNYARGTTAMLFATFAVDDFSADPVTFTAKALGTTGTASATWRSCTVRDGGPFTVGMPLYEETFLHESAAFRDAVQAGAPLPSTIEDAAVTAEVLNEARRAALG